MFSLLVYDNIYFYYIYILLKWFNKNMTCLSRDITFSGPQPSPSAAFLCVNIRFSFERLADEDFSYIFFNLFSRCSFSLFSFDFIVLWFLFYFIFYFLFFFFFWKLKKIITSLFCLSCSSTFPWPEKKYNDI